MNDKYYFDIKKFPSQFAAGFELAKNIKAEGEFNRVVVCGMGGSSLFVSLINDYFATDNTVKIQLEAVKAYEIPKNTDNKTLFLISSYSGNTEETLACLDQVDARGYSYIILTSGGELEKKALQRNAPMLKIPQGIQPRLSTGYFIGGILQILHNCGLISDKETEVVAAAGTIENSLDENKAKELAKRIEHKVPVIYATDNNKSLAEISKIKFNENSKTQAFHNYFPELNHNEMVGFTNIIMPLFFIIFQSQLTTSRNAKRIEIFKQLMGEKQIEVDVITLRGRNVLEEILMGYFFIDHVTYYLADAYGVDPKAVAMVEEFKKLL